MEEKDIYAGLLKCGLCGKSLYAKHNNGIHSYLCQTTRKKGKDVCPSKQIRRDQLDEITVQVTGNKEDLSAVSFIEIFPEKVIYHLEDGSSAEYPLHAVSRKDAWSEEQKEQARKKAVDAARKEDKTLYTGLLKCAKCGAYLSVRNSGGERRYVCKNQDIHSISEKWLNFTQMSIFGEDLDKFKILSFITVSDEQVIFHLKSGEEKTIVITKKNTEEEIYQLLKDNDTLMPKKEMKEKLGISEDMLKYYLNKLLKENKVEKTKTENKIFYKII